MARLGPAAALTGPAARGDWATLERHRRALARRRASAATTPAWPWPTGWPQRARAAGGGAGADTAGRRRRRRPAGRGRGRRRAERGARSTAAAELPRALDAARAAGRPSAWCPTMGALHAGHESLIARAAAECDVVAVTIFVNPLQFGDPTDLDRYPRTLDADLEACGPPGRRVVFAPTVAEMYPDWPGAAAPPWCRWRRGGAVGGRVATGPLRGRRHGGGQAVRRWPAAAGPTSARRTSSSWRWCGGWLADLCFPVEVVGCPTVREPDGLALSSRNARLSPEERRAAAVLSRALSPPGSRSPSGERRPGAPSAALMAAVVATEPLVALDYAAVVDPATSRTPDGPRRPAGRSGC